MPLQSVEATREVLDLWVIAQSGTPEEQVEAKLQIAGIENAAQYLSGIFRKDHNMRELWRVESVQLLINAWFK